VTAHAAVEAPAAPLAWLDRYLERARDGELDAPPSAFWIVTRACNLRCSYCFASAGRRDPDELTTAEAVRVLDDFAENGVVHVTFLGGEPLGRRDIFELIDHATDLGIYVAILTNGLLTDRRTVARLADVGCEGLGVSLDSDDPAVHDAVRGTAGSHAGALRSIREAIDRGMRTSIRVVTTERSAPAVPRLFEWALAEGVDEFILLPLFAVGRAAGTPDDRRADVASKELFFRSLARLRELGATHGVDVPHQTIGCIQPIDLTPPESAAHHVGYRLGFERSSGCKVGRFTVSVQPNGDVYPCPFVHHRIGSLRSQGIREIWQAPLLRLARREQLGCLARSMIHTGRPDVPDPTDAAAG